MPNPLIETSPIPPYAFRSPDFSRDLRCSLCRTEQVHTLTQHLVDISISPKPLPIHCRHDYRDGDLCSRCDNPKPLRRGAL